MSGRAIVAERFNPDGAVRLAFERATAGRRLAVRVARRVASGQALAGWLQAGLHEAAEADGRVMALGPATRAFLRDVEVLLAGGRANEPRG